MHRMYIALLDNVIEDDDEDDNGNEIVFLSHSLDVQRLPLSHE